MRRKERKLLTNRAEHERQENERYRETDRERGTERVDFYSE